ncbi:BMP family protein (plasmid) [Streptomyces sp. AHU1]|uniref:BMP family lipoprotein n=1 Tax=Streptomyces sp. AHU1 TaxID=3377215 RepID=UPI003877AAEF
MTDTGGIDDKGFNASAWAGMQEAQNAGAAKVKYVTSQSEDDYVPNLANLVAQKCDLITTVGGLMAQATADSSKGNPSQKYAIVDSAGNGKNIRGLQFNAAQSSFLGGYLAASYSKSEKVATYGGMNVGPVTTFMDGFWEGVQYYNKRKHADVQVLGWNEKTRRGVFAGGFNDQTKGQQLATNFAQQGADVVFPVAGATGLGTAAAAKSSNGKYSVLWVDVDGCKAVPQYCSVFLSTVFRDVTAAVRKAVVDGSKGQATSRDFVGTLANKGTGLSPFHDFESKVDAKVKAELNQIRASIIDGSIKITSPSQPK